MTTVSMPLLGVAGVEVALLELLAVLDQRFADVAAALLDVQAPGEAGAPVGLGGEREHRRGRRPGAGGLADARRPEQDHGQVLENLGVGLLDELERRRALLGVGQEVIASGRRGGLSHAAIAS
jgi:hypothetical protein